MTTKGVLKFFLLGILSKTLLEQYYSFFAFEPDNWGELFVKDVTDKLESCVAPSYWRPEVNYKKICQLDGSKYYLKAATKLSLREVFAREFANKNIGVRAPDTELLYEANGRVCNYFGMSIVKSEYYVASKAIDAFKAAASLVSSNSQGFFASGKQIRANYVARIGEQGIAKFVVASTFYEDLHLENWGYNAYGLVLIDVDTMPDNIAGFFDVAIDNIGLLARKGMLLSLNNIREIKLNYEKMQHKSLPKVHKSVDMSKDMYSALTKAYQEVCEYAIQKIKLKVPNLKDFEPDSCINDILEEGFREVRLKYNYKQIRKNTVTLGQLEFVI